MWKYSTLVSVQILLSNFLGMSFLLSWDEILFSFPFCVEGNLRLVWKENSQVALILFFTFRSTALPPQTSFFLQARTWLKHQRPPVKRVSWVFFFFVLLFVNPKDAQINISHKHCTFIGQNKPSELHVSTFQVKEKNNIDYFFLDAWPFLKLIPSV